MVSLGDAAKKLGKCISDSSSKVIDTKNYLVKMFVRCMARLGREIILLFEIRITTGTLTSIGKSCFRRSGILDHTTAPLRRL